MAGWTYATIIRPAKSSEGKKVRNMGKEAFKKNSRWGER